MPFPFRYVVLSSALAAPLAVVAVHANADDTLQPPTLVSDSSDKGTNPGTVEGGPLTPMDQGTSAEDVRMTQSVRQALTNDDKLSVEAQNVKIITRDGVVTLRGQVTDAKERAAIVAAAKRTAGVKRVDDQLTSEPAGAPNQPSKRPSMGQ